MHNLLEVVYYCYIFVLHKLTIKTIKTLRGIGNRIVFYDTN